MHEHTWCVSMSVNIVWGWIFIRNIFFSSDACLRCQSENKQDDCVGKYNALQIPVLRTNFKVWSETLFRIYKTWTRSMLQSMCKALFRNRLLLDDGSIVNLYTSNITALLWQLHAYMPICFLCCLVSYIVGWTKATRLAY